MLNVKCAIVIIITSIIMRNEASRILSVFPIPNSTHQMVLKCLIVELLKQGHEIVLVTSEPISMSGQSVKNLTEINIHDLATQAWAESLFGEQIIGKRNEWEMHFHILMKNMMKETGPLFLKHEIQSIMKEEFDLVILEAGFITVIGLLNAFKGTPVIQTGSLGSFPYILKIVGAPIHPFLYQTHTQLKVFNLSLVEKVDELYDYLLYEYAFENSEEITNNILEKVFGIDFSTVSELKRNIDTLQLPNVHSMWESNRPVPLNVVYLGNLHKKSEEKLPEELESYLNSSKNGVIYVSFGTTVEPALLPPETISALVSAFSKLPYDILWKWNRDELPGQSENIRISKWLPQADLLRHPKIKLFITQGGLQSTDEAITAGVPVIGLPILGDQWFNTEHYVHYGVGMQVELDTITEAKMIESVETVINDSSYRQNMIKLRSWMRDQPQSSLERAVWWIEYVLRHGTAKHLRSPSANMPWTEYYEIELVCYLVIVILVVLLVLTYILNHFLYPLCRSLFAHCVVPMKWIKEDLRTFLSKMLTFKKSNNKNCRKNY